MVATPLPPRLAARPWPAIERGERPRLDMPARAEPSAAARHSLRDRPDRSRVRAHMPRRQHPRTLAPDGDRELEMRGQR